MPSICLLAPVPEEHLESGLRTCQSQGKVAFGSRAWEVFRKLDHVIKESGRCDALIYASHAKVTTRSPMVTWRATYVGHNNAVNGAHKEGMKYRPQSTASYPPDNRGDWVIFWEVGDLRRLEDLERIPVNKLIGYDGRRRYLNNFIPPGPLIVEMP